MYNFLGFTTRMGAAVTKYHTDASGFYHIDEICPGMSVDGKPVQCIKPSESSSDEERKLGARKYFLVTDPVANPQMASMLPYPVDGPGFFLDTMDHETKKDIAGDAGAFNKSLYYITTQRDPRGSAAEKVKATQVPSTWCSHIKPCPSGIPCCPEVAAAVPVVLPPNALSTAAANAKKTWYRSSWLRTTAYIVLIVGVLLLARKLLNKPPVGRRRAPTLARPRDFNAVVPPTAPDFGEF
jgi:hypothetical protein